MPEFVSQIARVELLVHVAIGINIAILIVCFVLAVRSR